LKQLQVSNYNVQANTGTGGGQGPSRIRSVLPARHIATRCLTSFLQYTDSARIVLVPDASSSASTALADTAWGWLLPIVTQARCVAEFYEFQFQPEHRDAEVWQHLSDAGDALLSNLLQLQRQTLVPEDLASARNVTDRNTE